MRRFYDAFNASDLDGFVDTLDPEVELHTMQGLRRGRDQARKWATKKPGGVQQTIVIEELRESGERLLALVRRDWHWEGTDDAVDSEQIAAVFTIRDGKVAHWQAFRNRPEALAAAGLE